jgi:hypothetical protein
MMSNYTETGAGTDVDSRGFFLVMRGGQQFPFLTPDQPLTGCGIVSHIWVSPNQFKSVSKQDYSVAASWVLTCRDILHDRHNR